MMGIAEEKQEVEVELYGEKVGGERESDSLKTKKKQRELQWT